MHVTSSSSSISSNSSTSDTQDSSSKDGNLISTTTEKITMGGIATSEGKISFSVFKKKTTQIVTHNKLIGKVVGGDDEDDEAEEGARKRGIAHLENGIIVDIGAPEKKKEKKVFFIPVLQSSNQAQIERLKKLLDDGTATDQDKARLALLQEGVGGGAESGGNLLTRGDEKIGLPNFGSIGMPTIVIPDEVDPDYDSMPVGEFGLAFLRGCGWKDERTAIGKTNAQAVPLKVTKSRPKGLGLGATLPSEPPSDAKMKKEGAEEKEGAAMKNGVNKREEDEAKALAKNAYVKCLGGLHKGVYGQVVSMDEENSSVFLELSWPSNKAGRTIRVSQFAVELVTRTEYRTKLGGGEDGRGGAKRRGAEENGVRSNGQQKRLRD